MRSIVNVIIIFGLALRGSSPNPAVASPTERDRQTAVTPDGPPTPFRKPGEAEAAAVKALAGDADAAWALSFHFAEKPFVDRERSNYWMKIAVENRNPNALYYYGEKLGQSDDPCLTLRSIYYLELALKFTRANNADFKAGVQSAIATQRKRVAALSDSKCLHADTSLPEVIGR